MKALNIALAGNSAWSILNFRRNLIEKIISEGHKVWIIAPADSAVSDLKELGCLFEDIPIARKGLNPFQDFSLVLQYRALMVKYSFDYIFSFNPKPNLYNCFASYFLKTKIIVNISGLGSAFLKNNFITKLILFMYKVALSRSYKIFFQNTGDQITFESLGIIPKNSSIVLPGSGIDLQLFSKNNYHLSNIEKIHFTFVGRLLTDKGLVEFLEASKICLQQCPNLIFNICGNIDHGNPSSIDEDIIHLYQSKSIIFQGQIANIKDALSKSHCIVLPSYREGLSRSLLEGAASGIPLIATDVPGCRELVDDGKNGFLCRPRDSEDLAKQIIKFASMDVSSIIKMGDFSRLKAEQEFSVDVVVSFYLESLR